MGEPLSPREAALYLPQLERSLRVIQKYAFLYSETPFRSDAPVAGPLIVGLQTLARRVLRGVAGAALGPQSEFNAAVAEILFEFTRRAALAQTPAADSTLAQLAPLAEGAAPREQAFLLALDALTREVAALREAVRAANVSAAAAEARAAELARELEGLKPKP